MDTGPLVAAANGRDPLHEACLNFLQTAPGPFFTTGLVIAEVTYWLDKYSGPKAEESLLTDIVEGRLVVEELTIPEWERVRDLVVTYSDFPLGATDASLIALAERHGTTTVATTDHRHFDAVRPLHCSGFTLLP